jgi:hypothetical protein
MAVQSLDGWPVELMLQPSTTDQPLVSPPPCPQTPYLKWLRNQHLMSMLYMLYLIAVVVNFLGCLW